MPKYISKNTIYRMRKVYSVTVCEAYYKTVTVEAGNVEEALKRAGNYDCWIEESELDYVESEVGCDAEEMEGILDEWYKD